MAALAELSRPSRETLGSAASVTDLAPLSSEERIPSCRDASGWQTWQPEPRQTTLIVQYRASRPGWVKPVVEGLNALLSLPADWDSYGAAKIDRDFVQAAIPLIARMLGDADIAPAIVPISSGGFQLEWHALAIDLEATFEPGCPPTFWLRDTEEPGGLEGDLSRNIALIQRRIARAL